MQVELEELQPQLVETAAENEKMLVVIWYVLLNIFNISIHYRCTGDNVR